MRETLLARLAWYIGNRHVDVQIVGERLRLRRDHVIEAMLRGLGARLTPLEALNLLAELKSQID